MSDFPKITFDVADISVDRVTSANMFEGMRAWFIKRGYTPYTFQHNEYSVPTLDTEVVANSDIDKSPFPYAYVGGEEYGWPTVGQLSAFVNIRVFFAQDAQGRHVAIKLMKKDSDEYKIACFLHEHADVAVEHCIIPVLEIIDCEEHAFMVMPRWGDVGHRQWLHGMRNVLDYAHCALKGLAFLHDHGIIHRDLKQGNILCNHFGTGTVRPNFLRQELMIQRKLVFAIADFDLSLMLPPSSRPRRCRLPTRCSWEVNVEVAHDVLQGELDYDPFLFDVGTLGLLFALVFEKCIPLAPVLAPLIDSMVTDDLPRRFTASEALQFFEQTVDSVPVENLDVQVLYPKLSEDSHYLTPDLVYLDRWVGLPPDFVAKWSAYRVQKPNILTRAIRWFCSLNARTFFIVQAVRFLVRGRFKAALYRALYTFSFNEEWYTDLV